ncbi:hypothetical protein NADE_006496 [Nannochloris sp. 'desiccata']|nr:hypothetical protein NADE_006496 [Chlorella desiccata (nom. nud.)]
MILSDAYGGSATYSVASVQVKPNTSATILTTTGEEFIVDAEGIRTSGDDTSGGRRLLFWNIVGDFVGGIVGRRLVPSSAAPPNSLKIPGKMLRMPRTPSPRRSRVCFLAALKAKRSSISLITNANSIRTCASNPVNNYATCIAFVPCGTILNNVYKNCKGR